MGRYKQRVILVLIALFILAGWHHTYAQKDLGGGITLEEMRYYCIGPVEHNRIQLQLKNSIEALNSRMGIITAKSENVKFHWPIRQASGFVDQSISAISNFVDHNANFPGVIRDYNCGAA